MRTRPMIGVVAAAALAWCVPAAIAQTYPDKPIRLVVPYTPGGNVDVTARVVGTSLNAQFGQPVIVDNRAGADGAIGTNAVARSAPNGYTLLMGSSSSVTAGPALNPDLPYDPVRDFAAVSMVQIVPNVVVASLNTPVANLNDLIALAKQRPGQIKMAHGGTAPHLAIALLYTMAGVEFLIVPYKAAGLALPELVSGQVDSMLITLAGASSLINSGRLKALAVTTLKRSSLLPNVPTLDELGFKGFEASGITGVLAPAGTPPAVVNALNSAIRTAVRSPAARETFKKMGADPQESTPEEFSAYIRNDIDKWKKVAKVAGIKAE